MWTLVFPAAFAVLHYKWGKYVLSALVTLSCLLISIYFHASPILWAAYALSVVGDYFMAHSDGKNGDRMLLGGIVFFFLAHACFLFYSIRLVRWDSLGWLRAACAAALIVGYAVFLFRVLLPAIREGFLKAAASAYTCISLAVFSASLFSRHPWPVVLLFALGIAMILFSDTLIALSRFLKKKRLNRVICPTYFACHILVAASQILLVSWPEG